MSTPNNPSRTSQKVAPAVAAPEDERWDDIETGRDLLSWEKMEEAGLKSTIEGWLLGEEIVKGEQGKPGEKGYMREFICLRIRLTSPCEIITPSSEKKTVKTGRDLLVGKSYSIAELADLTIDPETVRKVRITPIDTIPLPGARTMHRYKVQLSSKTARRVEVAPNTQAKMIAEMRRNAALALTEGNGSVAASTLPAAASVQG